MSSTPSAEDARKALLGKRFGAALIDGLVCFVLMFALGVIHPLVGVLGAGIYILIKDGLNLPFMNQRSFGKTILGVRPVRLVGGDMDIQTSALRNWPLAVPLLFDLISGGLIYAILSIVAFVCVGGELVLTLTQRNGRRFGDQLAGTEVR